MPKEEASLEAYFTEILQRINEIEEKTKINKNKINLLASSTITKYKKTEEELNGIRENLSKMADELEKLKQKVDYLLSELPGLVRKEDLSSIEKFIKLWQPLKFATLEDVERIVNRLMESEMKARLKEKAEKAEEKVSKKENVM
jgi:uncharacterized protein YecE (DUF72 family)